MNLDGMDAAERQHDRREHPSYYTGDEEAEDELLPDVYCSSCGEGFSHGKEGFSDCTQHEGLEQTT